MSTAFYIGMTVTLAIGSMLQSITMFVEYCYLVLLGM